MKNVYFATATLHPSNEVVTVWLKATNIITAMNQAFPTIESEFQKQFETYTITGIWLGGTSYYSNKH